MTKTLVGTALQALLIAGAASALCPSSAFAEATTMTAAQSKIVKGHVVDKDGEPLIGVTVKSTKGNVGAVTDIDGNFSIDISKNSTFVISYAGHKTQTVTIKDGITIQMEPDLVGLDDVVVIGYGTMKKRDLTGSISSVKADEIAKTPTTNVMEAIQGMVPGFDITRSSGEIGAEMNLSVRGNRSIYGNNEPLFIIDGMEGSFSELNPNDIESIEVLKDASSTAIYGAAGSNGVILITTKNAAKGKFNINFDAYWGINKCTSFPEVRTGQDYIDFRRQALKNAEKYTDDSALFPSYMQELIDNNQWVDWFKEGSQTGTMQEYNLSTTYSNDRLNAFASMNYSDTNGLLKGDEMKRYSIRAKFDFKANSIITYGLNFYGVYTDNDKRNSRIWNRMLCTAPVGTPYDENGNVVKYPVGGDTGMINPVLDTADGAYTNKIRTISAQPQAYVEITPLNGLSFKSVLGGYFSARKQGQYAASDSWDGLQTGSFAQVPNTLIYNYKWQNILTYNLDINNDHHITFTGVTEWAKNNREVNTARADGFTSDAYLYHNLGAGASPRVSSSFVQTKSMSYVLRANYSYKGRYLASVSNRWDGSSILASGHKWDSFPAVSVGWRISDEAFMEGAKSWLDNLKIRASYGVTGNAGASAYATQNVIRTGLIGFQDVSTLYSGYSATVANAELGWEKSSSWNIGLDAAIINNRIDFSVDWYSTTTKDLLFQHKLPYAVGGYGGSNFTVWQNVGKTRNTGIELVINSRNILTKDFKWNTTLTFAANNEKVLETTQDNPLKFNDYYLIKDQPIHTYYMYKYLGIWGTGEAEEAAKYGAQPGDIKILDVDESGKYSADDYQIIGHADPKWTASLTNSFQYKDFDLSFQLIARWGQTIAYGVTGWYRCDGINPTPAVCDYWTTDNQGARYPAPNANKGEDSYQHNSSLDYFDGSYIKIKNLTLGYTVPKVLTKKIGVERARVYLTTTNPFIWTKSSYFKNYDPEKGGDDDDTPLSKQFVFGVNLTF